MTLPLSTAKRVPRRTAGLTLIEMMVVLFIMAVLAGIGFTMVPRLKQKGYEDRAAADLLVIQQGLEAYRAKFGDYPRTSALPGDISDSNMYLFNALNGRIGPAGDLIDIRPMLNNALLTLEISELPHIVDEELKTAPNRVLDPWGNAYLYDYRPRADNWDRFGYVLYSTGGDGQDDEGKEDDIVAK